MPLEYWNCPHCHTPNAPTALECSSCHREPPFTVGAAVRPVWYAIRWVWAWLSLIGLVLVVLGALVVGLLILGLQQSERREREAAQQERQTPQRAVYPYGYGR